MSYTSRLFSAAVAILIALAACADAKRTPPFLHMCIIARTLVAGAGDAGPQINAMCADPANIADPSAPTRLQVLMEQAEAARQRLFEIQNYNLEYQGLACRKDDQQCGK